VAKGILKEANISFLDKVAMQPERTNIVLAYNSSKSSDLALEWILDHFIDPSKHCLTIITVLEPTEATSFLSADEVTPKSNITKVNQFCEKVAKKLEDSLQIAKKNVLERGLNCDTFILRGEVRDEIVDFVKEKPNSMLIIGSRDNGTLKRYPIRFNRK
jgi:nucleotide-binding universal stress UspA family protein